MMSLEWGELGIRLAWFAIGSLVGCLVGWHARELRMLRRIDQEVHDVKEQLHRHEEDGTAVLDRVFMAIVVGIVLVAAVMAGTAATRVDRQLTCGSEVLADVLISLDERSAFADRQADVDQHLRTGLSDALDAILDPPPVVTDSRPAAVRLRSAVATADEAAKRAAVRRDKYPYPEPALIVACLRGAEHGEPGAPE